jgi:hypothetical protein
MIPVDELDWVPVAEMRLAVYDVLSASGAGPRDGVGEILLEFLNVDGTRFLLEPDEAGMARDVDVRGVLCAH